MTAPARDLLERGGQLGQLAHAVVDGEARLRTDASDAFTVLRDQMVRRELSTIPVARLRDATEGRLRLGTLEQAGFGTVLRVFEATPQRLTLVPGVGRTTATQAVAAARQVADAVKDSIRVRVDLDPGNAASTALLVALHRLGSAERDLSRVREPATRLDRELSGLLAAARRGRSRLRMMFAGRKGRAEVAAALDRIGALLEWAEQHGVPEGLTRAAAAVRGPAADPAAVWTDFERRSPEYYGLLGEIVDLRLDVASAEGSLSAEVVAQVHEQRLDDRYRRVSLRGYQSFGARFALVQRRVILGDEMGLGKTIQAIAAIAHLRALDRTHFLVVCPASVLLNWIREIHMRSELSAYRLHGTDRSANLRTWIRSGGIAVTTYESLRTLTVPDDLHIAMLVVDEAHYVKNPSAKRTRAVRRHADGAERVLFLTGTPMENRVGEFRNLVGYLRPDLAANVDGVQAIAAPAAFRRAVAPVYLRRNQRDVLAELPDLVHTDEWVEFTDGDVAVYRAAVAAGNFMAMRRAAYASGDPARSAKLERLLELVGEAAENDRKVVIFSFFRDVLDTVMKALGPAALGPLNGGMPAADRLALVDRFSEVDGHAVLVSQIRAGGVGMNMQAASVVILCEPQLTPTTEEQAIARAYRMGQVRSVQVHRLLAEDSVDQRLLEVLDRKARLFDEYARHSDVAAASPEALDISDVELARRIVVEEQERLAINALSAPTAETNPAVSAD